MCQPGAERGVPRLRQTAERATNLAQNAKNNNLVPVYTEWESTSVVGPVIPEQTRKSRQSNPQAQSPNGNPGVNKPRAQGGQTAAPHATPETVRNVTGSVTSIGLDPQMAYTHLQAAKSALAQSDLKRADSALAALPDFVLIESFKSDLPLLKARQNLALACQGARRGDNTEASAALRSAGSGLGEYANAYPTSTARKAERLRQQIDSYANNIANNRTDVQDAQNQVRNWWNQVSALMHQPSPNSQPQG